MVGIPGGTGGCSSLFDGAGGVRAAIGLILPWFKNCQYWSSVSRWFVNTGGNERSERTKAGLARAVAQGKKLVRPEGSRGKMKRKRRRLL
ncbi:hypothetical protein ACFLYR_07435 [Chloroflexota bacterium]